MATFQATTNGMRRGAHGLVLQLCIMTGGRLDWAGTGEMLSSQDQSTI